MTLQNLRLKIQTPIFSHFDVLKVFPNEPENQINTQLYRMAKRGDVIALKRGVYIFPDSKIDDFVIANKLYTPSYVSLESALNVYGIIPDVSVNVTSVTTITSKKLDTPLGLYLYSKINKDLFFGFTSILDTQSGIYYNIALPEKALLDFVYIRRVRILADYRIDTSGLNSKKLKEFATHYPKWVSEVIKNA